MRRYIYVFFAITLLSACSEQKNIELKNSEFALELATDQNGLPLIKRGYWLDSKKEAFVDKEMNNALSAWMPADLLPDSLQADTTTWEITQKTGVSLAEFEQNVGKLKMSWTVELFDKGAFFRMYVRVKNISETEVSLEWFPVWAANWDLPSPNEKSVETWQPLSYSPISKKLEPQNSFTLSSNVYSSDIHDKDSQVPFWQIKGGEFPLYFSLGWSGGWKADFAENENVTAFNVKLPPEETQLRLQPGESITGPGLYVFASSEKNEELARAQWLFAREFAASLFYYKPDNFSPLVYNHWYSCGFDLSGEYIQNQLAAMPPYNFDVFVIDAGWYNKVGDWRPSMTKFKPGEFETIFQDVKQAEIRTGIWTCPWLREVEDDNFNEDFEEPHFYREFMNAYALDLVGTNFEKWAVEHIAYLKTQFPVDWWKYDQELFGENSRAGKMKNVIALQNGLAAVRNSYPGLYIENCMSGGRMINEFTDQIAQAHWISDGSQTGLEHARSNIQEALGAARFLAPLKIQRWTNRPNEIDENNGELLKLYCRSAMVGTWGISADLNKISEKQRDIILSQVEVYNKLEPFKQSMKYEILYPGDDSQVVGIVFYHITGEKAAVLLYRWNSNEECIAGVNLGLLKDGNYTITNWDTGENESGETGKEFPDFKLGKDQMSAIYFIYDGDDLDDLGEFQIGTYTNEADSDDDGIPDEWETEYDLNPLDDTDAGGDAQEDD